MTLTQSWTTANSLDTKVELEDKLAKGAKAELLANFVPHSQAYGAKVNMYFKQPLFHTRLFCDLMKGPVATADLVVGQQGFMAGVEAGYNVQKAAMTRTAAAVGYSGAVYSATVSATNDFSVFSAAYYHKVNSQVEAGAKAVWDSKAGNNVGVEVASKYRLDPTSFAKVKLLPSACDLGVILNEGLQAKINDRGVAAVAYNVLLRPGLTLGLGASFDTQKLNEGSHKVCNALGTSNNPLLIALGWR